MTSEIETCRRTWRKLGVSRHDADEMSAELGADLAAASAEGLPSSAVIGTDVRVFATEWARERGVVRFRLRLVSTAGAALVGAIPGAAFALFAAYGLQSQGLAEMFGGEMIRVGENAYEPMLSPPTWLLLLLYTLGAAFAYAGAVAAVAAALHLRRDLLIERTVRLLAATLPVATAAGIGATILYSSTTGFSDELHVVVTDVIVASSVFAACVAVIRYAAVRRERGCLVPRQA